MTLKPPAMSTELAVTLIIYLSLFLNFFMVASFDCLGPRLTELHHIDKETYSVIISAKSFVNLAMGPAMALVSPKLPPTLLFTIGGLGLGGAYIGLAFSVSQAGFLISRGLHGIGTSGLMVGGMSVLMRCVPKKERGRYTSIAYSAAGHAPLVAPLLSGLMFEKLGQAWTYLIPGILTLTVSVGSLLLLIRLSKRPPVEPSRSGSSTTATMDKSHLWPCVKRIMTNPWSVIALGGIFCDGFSFGCCESTLPQLLTDWEGGLSVLTTSLIYSAGPLTFTIAAPIAGYFVDKVGHYKVLLCGLCVYMVTFPFFDLLVSTSLAGLAACIVFAFLGCAIVEVSIYPLITSITESTGYANSETVGYALNELFIQLGFAVGSLSGRQLLDWKGLLAMGGFVSGLDAIIVSLSLFIVLVIVKADRSKMKIERAEKGGDDEEGVIAVGPAEPIMSNP